MMEWVFEVGSMPIWLSTKATTYDGNTYAGAITPSSFAGVTMRWDVSGSGLIAPNDISFEVAIDADIPTYLYDADDEQLQDSDGENLMAVGASYTASQFQDEFVIVRQIIDGSENRSWKFKITSALYAYGAIQCHAEHFLNEHLEGDWPNTPAPKEVWPSDDTDTGDDYCIPIILGSSYIPLRSVNTGSDRYYVLGVDSGTFSITKVKTPRGWLAQKEWASASYTMTQSTDSGYKLVQPIIDDQDDDGTADAVGLWPSGSGFLDMLCLFSNSNTSSTTSPADWIEYVLESFGVASGDIDATTFGTAETSYSGDSITFNGGFWRKQNRERILSNLLSQVDSFLVPEDDLKLYRFDKTSIETVTNAQELTYRPRRVSKSANDSGRVHWPESSTAPQDVLTGQKIVPITSGGTTASPVSTILECKFLAGQSQNAQISGTLYFQKMLGQEYEGSFSVPLSELTTKATICPGKVIRINNSFYGGDNDVIITEITFTREGDAQIGFVKLETMNDWGDFTSSPPSVVPIMSDSSDAYPLEVDEGIDITTNPIHFIANDIRTFRMKGNYATGIASLDFEALSSVTSLFAIGSAPAPFDSIELYGDTSIDGNLDPGSTGLSIGDSSNVWDTAYFDKMRIGGTGLMNELEGYSRGLHKIVFVPDTGTITLNSSYEYIAWHRVGREVTCTGRVDVSSVSTPDPSGAVSFDLPFNVSASLDTPSQKDTDFFSVVIYGVINSGVIDLGDLLAIYADADDTEATFIIQDNAGSSASTAGIFKAGTYIYFSFMYYTDDSY